MERAEPECYRAKVEEVNSGDDLILMVDLGVDGLHKRQRVRLKDVDTPSQVRRGRLGEAEEVRRLVASLCTGKSVEIQLAHRTAHAWVVTLLIPSGDGPINLNQLLMSKGYAYGRDHV